MGPTAGKMSNRYGSGTTLMFGSMVLLLSLLFLLIPYTAAVVVALLGVCTGFFALHAAAVGTLNKNLDRGQGRANALYVLFYYVGGWIGITTAGFLYQWFGWWAVIVLCLLVLSLPFSLAVQEFRQQRRYYSNG